MAGLFYVLGISSWITWIRSGDSLVSILKLLHAGSGKVFLSTSDTQIVHT